MKTKVRFFSTLLVVVDFVTLVAHRHACRVLQRLSERGREEGKGRREEGGRERDD